MTRGFCARWTRCRTIVIMRSVVISSKWQVTIPEEIRKEGLSLAVGQRLGWEVVDGVLLLIPVRSLMALAGCLHAGGMPVLSRQEEKAAVARARVEHYAKKYGRR